MKIEHRLNCFCFLEHALHEFQNTFYRRECYRLNGQAYSEDDFKTIEIFSPPNMDDFLEQISCRKIDQALSTIKDILDNSISIKQQQYYYLVKKYFSSNMKVAGFISDADNYFIGDEKSRLLYRQDQLSRIGSFVDYYPQNQEPLLLTNAMKLEAANPYEQIIFPKEEYSSILTIRDLYFVSNLFDESVITSNRIPNDFELSCRKLVKAILTNHYSPQIVNYNALFARFLDSIQKIVDEEMESLIDRKYEATNIDTWGEVNYKLWNRYLRMFIRNVVLPQVTVPRFVLYLNIVPIFFEHISSLINSGNLQHVIISYSLNYDLINQFDRVSCASSKALQETEIDTISVIINFMINIKENELEKTSNIENSFSFSEFENVEIHQRKNTHKNNIDFEQEARRSLEMLRFTVMKIPETDNQGVDIIATRNGKRWAIQCKSKPGRVGNAAVQKVIDGKIFYNCNYACIITDSSFTPSAYKLATKAGVIMCADNYFESLIINALF